MTDKSTIRIDKLIDEGKLGRVQIIIFLTTIIVFTVDGFDLQIVSYLMPAIGAEWDISTQMQGVTLSAGLTGLLIGYLTLPFVGTRIGLRRLVIASLLFMSLVTFLTLTATSAEMFILLRVLTGVTLGGVFPNMMALAAEYCPERYRASLVSITYVGLPLGFLLAGWTSLAILPHFGWQGALAVGGVLPIIAAILVFSTIPESLDYLTNRAPNGMARARKVMSRVLPDKVFPPQAVLTVGAARPTGATLADLFRERRWVGTLALWVGLAMNSVVYYFVLSWMPSILVRIGADQHTAIIASSLANIGGIFAAFITGPLMDRYGAYPVLIAHFLVGALFTIVVGALLSPELIAVVLAALCLGFCVSGLQKGVSALAVRFYAIDLRSIGLGWTLGIGRIGAIGGPFVAGLLLAAGWSPTAIFYVMSVPLLIGGLGVLVMGYFYGNVTPPSAKASTDPVAAYSET